MANVTITQLPLAGPITGTESVPVVQNGQTVRTTAGAIAAAPTQTQTFLTINNEPTLPNSRYLSTSTGIGLVDGGAQSFYRLTLNAASGSLEVASNGIIAKTASNAVTARAITVTGAGLSITDGDGVAGNPTLGLTGLPLALANTGGTGFLAVIGGTVLAGRQIYGTPSQIDVTDGNGSNDPVLSLSADPVIPGTGAMRVPVGTNAQQPVGTDGQIRYNSDTGFFEGYSSGSWNPFTSGGGVTSFSGGTTGLTPSSPTIGPVVLGGTLAVSNGGSGATSLTGYLVGNGTSPFTAVATIPNAGLTNDSVTIGTTSIALGASSLTLGGLTSVTVTQGPLTAFDLATKQYVDTVAEGLHIHAACAAATPATLASITGGTVTYNNGTAGVGATLTLSNPLTILDGYTLQNGDRVLVKNEATQANNGIYTWATGGTVLTRATDFDTAAEIAGGDFTFVTNGTLYDNTGWVQTDEVATVGTDPIVFVQFSGAGSYASNLTGGTANQIPYQTAPSTTSFITAPTVASTVLQWNGSAFQWATVTTAPAGSNTEVQFNNAGAFGASANLTFDGSKLSVYGVEVGRGAGAVATNTAVGATALQSNTTGSNNTAVGTQTLYSATTASNNVAVGHQSLYNSTGADNTAVGQNSGNLITTGAKNTILGRFNGNQGGLDIRTASNYIVLSDGDGNPRAYWNGADATIGGNSSFVTTTATPAQDGVIVTGRAGGTSSYRATVQPATLTDNRTITLPDNSGTVLTTGALVTVAQGGTGTSTPSLVAGTNVTISGAWPNQTINATGGGGSAKVGDIFVGTAPPTSGTWLETNGYYSKATYPALAANLGDVADIGPYRTPQSKFISNFTSLGFGTKNAATYGAVTDGTTLVAVGGSGAIRYTTNGTDWFGAPSGLSGSIYGVYYLNNRFIALSLSGTYAVSTDGINWVPGFVRTSSLLTSIAYGNSRYVVGAQSSIVAPLSNLAVSTDLLNWSFSSPVQTTDITVVVFGNSLFIAANSIGDILSSPDGITWTNRASTASRINDILYANNLFVAVGNNGVLFTSPDGTTWTNRNIGSNNFNRVTYENSLWCIASTQGVWTSSNGTTWTQRVTSTAANGFVAGVVWEGTRWVAPMEGRGLFYHSVDGITWVLSADASLQGFQWAVAFGGRTFGMATNRVIRLDNGISFPSTQVMGNASAITTGWAYAVSRQLSSTRPAPVCVAYNGTNQYVLVGSSGAILTSTDADTWTAVSVPNTSLASYDSVYYVNGRYFVCGANSTSFNLVTSTDGINWTALTITSLGYISAVAFGAGVWVAVGVSGFCYSSPDGVTWTSRSAGSASFSDITYAAGLFVAVTISNAIYTSPDGLTWTLRSVTGVLYRVVYNNSRFVAVGSARISTSTDGITWTTQVVGSVPLNSVVWNGTVWCAVGNNNTIYTSPDAVTWTLRPIQDTTPTLGTVIEVGGTLYAQFFEGSTLLVSTDNGVTWNRRATAVFVTSVSLTVAYLGNRFIIAGSGWATQSSSDGITWRYSSNVLPVNSSIPRLFKLGGVYYAQGAQYPMYSTDGTNWLPIRNAVGNLARFAYNGTVWTMAINGGVSSTTVALFRSTDGINWTLSQAIGTVPSNSSPPTLTGLEWGGTHFLVSLATVPTVPGYISNIYRSTDGISWTAIQPPFALDVVSSGMASDGTNIVVASTPGIFSTTNGGATYQAVDSSSGANSRILYLGGFWLINSTTANGATLMGTALNKLSATMTQVNISGLYVRGNYAYAFVANNYKMMTRVDNPSFVTIQQQSPISVGTPNWLATSSEIIEFGNFLMLPINVAANNARYPYIVAEAPVFSYNTATTFWVPPYASGGGFKAWICAVP